MLDLLNKRVCVTGGAGFLGHHIVRELHKYGALVSVPRYEQYDLREIDDIRRMFNDLEPEIIVHAAAHVGGIGLNIAKPAELFYSNAIMGIQLIHEAWLRKVTKFIQLGTICEYPLNPPIPFSESDLWSGYPESSNAPYGLSKKLLLVQGMAYKKQYNFNIIHLMPTNLYGPGDNTNPASSHVMPALIRKFVEAKKNNDPTVTVWGTGRASREFLYVADAADAIIKATQYYDQADPVNIGSGTEIRIADLARMIANAVGYNGEIVFNSDFPDGQPRRCLDTTKAEREFSFKASTSLETGLAKTITWYLKEQHVTL